MPAAAAPVQLLTDSSRLRVALSPFRRELLDRLREPASATEIASEVGVSRQRVNYHLRALEAAGFVELIEERQRRGFTERVLRASADAFVVDPSMMEANGAPVSQDRFAAEHLIATAGGVVRDVTQMQAAAGARGKRLMTFTLEAEVSFAGPADAERFADALAEAVAHVATQFNSPRGRRYRVVAGGHPAPARSTRRST